MKQNHELGIVQSNFICAYIYDKVKGDYGKAIIFYLEAIRNAEESTYERVNVDLISLHKNCGVIFRKFNSYPLAEEYYKKALSIAHSIQDRKEIASINFNVAGLLMDQKRYNDAISILDDLITNTDFDSKDYWKYNNRLGIALYESSYYDQAVKAHDNSLKYAELSLELRAYTIHNIGRCFAAQNNDEMALASFNKALELKNQLTDKTVLFSTYSELGQLAFKNDEIKKSLFYFNEAEKHIDEITDLDHFELYKLKADALFRLNSFNEAKRYEDLYSKNLNNYLHLQTEIQETDKRYNMDLITKRYFDEVEKQERIASILLYSKLISGTLLMLLLLSVGYNWYQKTKLRRSIVRELIDLKILD